MRQEKISIAPLLVFFVYARAEGLAGGECGSVPVQHVLVEGIKGREIEPAAEPPNGGTALRCRYQETDIAMGGRRVGTSRVKNQRYSHGFERRSGDFQPQVRSRLRHLFPVDMRKGYAGSLEYLAAAQHAALAAAAFSALPRIAPEFRGVERLYRFGDAIVQPLQVVLDRGCIRCGGDRYRAVGDSHRLNAASFWSSS